MYSCEAKDFAQWRASARPLIAARVRPEEIVWSDWREPNMFAQTGTHEHGGAPSATGSHASAIAPSPSTPPAPHAAPAGSPKPPHLSSLLLQNPSTATAAQSPSIPRELLDLLQNLACYRDASRWELMYRLTWRVLNENRALLENGADSDVQLARNWSKAVHRDVHKMHAFVRFHETESLDGGPRYVAWFEPAHEILESVVPFFEQRFPNMRWMIATPDGAAVWDGSSTTIVASPGRSGLPREDATHGLWKAYYRNICNVARINPIVMQREMPQRYWRHLPEASEIDVLLREGRHLNARNLETPAPIENLRAPGRAMSRSLQAIVLPEESLHACRRCDLWRNATQAIAGEGPEHASIMLVGEQPGDEEDVRGKPFTGPAGRLLDRILGDAGLDRQTLFVTNAVKHFKWEPRGKRRLHRRPNAQEVQACGGWLAGEIEHVSPSVIVALGATAIRALTGQSIAVEDARQLQLQHARGATLVCTYHPSAILRATDDRTRGLTNALRADLERASLMASASKQRHS